VDRSRRSIVQYKHRRIASLHKLHSLPHSCRIQRIGLQSNIPESNPSISKLTADRLAMRHRRKWAWKANSFQHSILIRPQRYMSRYVTCAFRRTTQVRSANLGTAEKPSYALQWNNHELQLQNV
jgi:hypothetical protein